MQHHLIQIFSLKVVSMAEGKRFGLSAMEKSDMWCRWKAGQSLHEIGRAFGKSHSSIRCVVSHHGGMAAVLNIEPRKGMTKPGSRVCGRKPAFLLSMRSCRRSLQVN